MLAHAVQKSDLRLSADPSGAGVYITARASAAGAPVIGGNVAVRGITPAGGTLGVTHGITDETGTVTMLLEIDWQRFPVGARFGIEGRLTPFNKYGPAQTKIEMHR